MEEIKETPVAETKATSQDEIDNAVASAKKRWANKVEKDYVLRTEYEELQAKFTQAQHDLKTPSIKDSFVKAGGKVEAFNDWIKLNGDAYDTKDLSKLLENSKKSQSYMFNPQQVNVTLGSSNGKVDTAAKLGLANGSLIRTK